MTADETISMLHHARSVLGLVRMRFETAFPPRLVLATKLATAQNEISEVLKEIEAETNQAN